jgi:hypothetical protein
MRKIYILIFFSGLLLSCSLKDNYKSTIEMTELEPGFDISTEYGQKMKSMFDKYGIIFNPDFTLEDFKWDWNTININYGPNTNFFRYTLADKAYVSEVIDSINRWVFRIFPDNFISDNLPIKIYMCDTLCDRYTFSNNLVYRWHTGGIYTNFTMIGYVSNKFNVEKKKRSLIESWVSLFVERMVTSSNIYVPVAFSDLSADGYAKSTYTNAEDVVTNYGLLKKGRNGQNSGSATAAWNKTTPAQDLGDFVAFIVYVPETEKQTIYNKNSKVKLKVDIVKDFFKTKYGIDLPYWPR